MKTEPGSAAQTLALTFRFEWKPPAKSLKQISWNFSARLFVGHNIPSWTKLTLSVEIEYIAEHRTSKLCAFYRLRGTDLVSKQCGENPLNECYFTQAWPLAFHSLQSNDALKCFSFSKWGLYQHGKDLTICTVWNIGIYTFHSTRPQKTEKQYSNRDDII